MPRWIPMLAAATIGAIGAPALAQDVSPEDQKHAQANPPDRITTLYRLDADSTFVEGCFEPCRCPLRLNGAPRGTFELAPAAGGKSGVQTFDVLNVNWVVDRSGEEIRVTGAGTYELGAGMQRLVLDLVVGDDKLTRYDSGAVAGAEGFPTIDLTISVNGMVCRDSVFTLIASPAPTNAARPYIISQGGFQTGCLPPCRCAITFNAFRGSFGLMSLEATDDGISAFAVTDLRFDLVSDRPIPSPVGLAEGQGVYEIDGANQLQRMRLTLSVGGAEDVEFDSGWVAMSPNPLRSIDISVADNDFVCFNRVFDFDARSLPIPLGWPGPDQTR